MGLEVFSDAAEFLERAGSYLHRDEAANNLVLSAAAALVQSPLAEAPFFAAYGSGREPAAAAVWIPGHKAVLSDGPAEAGRAFASEVAKRVPSVPNALPGALAPPVTGDAFAAACADSLGARPKAGLEQFIMKLDLRTPFPRPSPPDGRLRRAWLEDEALLRSWAQAMAAELKLNEAPRETAEITRRSIESRRLFVWDDGGPAAMFGHGGNTLHGARVHSVYVPPAKRRRGYASAGVWRLSELLRQAGKSFACLFADRRNEGSIRLYERLGYEVIGELNETRF